ncbi:MAG: hypothetical protein V7K67_09805 [Nostoc sp.]|uniref:hypothetical protein n=1 Tax=Nostoc sp. TaxID=1180 RepID=UPI002FF51F2C
MGIGDWGIGDWGLGIGDWVLNIRKLFSNPYFLVFTRHVKIKYALPETLYRDNSCRRQAASRRVLSLRQFFRCLLDNLPPTHVARRNFKNSLLHRCLSCFRRGFLVIKAAVLNRLPLPQGSFFPQPWPTLTPQLHVSQITLSTA